MPTPSGMCAASACWCPSPTWKPLGEEHQHGRGQGPPPAAPGEDVRRSRRHDDQPGRDQDAAVAPARVDGIDLNRHEPSGENRLSDDPRRVHREQHAQADLKTFAISIRHLLSMKEFASAIFSFLPSAGLAGAAVSAGATDCPAVTADVADVVDVAAAATEVFAEPAPESSSSAHKRRAWRGRSRLPVHA